MDTCRQAQKTLGLGTSYSPQELKRAYHKKAMEHHPDKNRGNSESTDRFREVHEAYETLLREKPTGERTQAEMLQDMVAKLMGGTVPLRFAGKLLDVMAMRFKNAWQTLLSAMDDDALDALCDVSSRYVAPDAAPPEYLRQIVREIQRRTRAAHYVLRPELSHLLDQECFMLQHDGEAFCVPLWYPETCYKAKTGPLIVRCQPKLPDYIDIDQSDTVHVSVSVGEDTLASGSVSVPLGGKHLKISAQCVTGRNTSHVFRGKGIPRTSAASALDAKRGDVVVHITRRLSA